MSATNEQGERVARALRQVFTFTPHGETEFICETEGGNYYLVSEIACSCADHCYRPGTICKHRIALAHWLLANAPWPSAQRPAPSAAFWLASLDTSGIKAHVEQAKREDAADDFEAEFERIFG